MKYSAGIDEAGRGCVLGSLVVACVVADESDRRWFTTHNVRDSKIVPPAQRTDLAKRIMDRCWFQTRIATASDIDIAVRDRTRTLNGLELELMAELLSDCRDAHEGRELTAWVDAPSINAQGFCEKLYSASGWEDMNRLRATHEADRRNRTVAAASIIAKYERDRLLDLIKKEYGIDFGCGYPHDPLTRNYIKTAPKNCSHIRWTWKTASSSSCPTS